MGLPETSVEDIETFKALTEAPDASVQVAEDIIAEHQAKVEEPKLPATAEELDQEYYRFYDLRVYTREIVDLDLDYELTQEDIDRNPHVSFAYLADGHQFLGMDSDVPAKQVGDKVPVIEELDILDVLATHQNIEASKARWAARRAKKFCQVAPDLKDREGDSRQVSRRKAHLRESFTPATEHVGFNRAMRRNMMRKMPKAVRIGLKQQMLAQKKKKSAEPDTKIADVLDKAVEA